MPLLGKRKYINEKIERMIEKLDNLGYDTEEIKDVFYERETNQRSDHEMINDLDSIADNNEDFNSLPMDEYSSGALLPYRNKINKTLKLIENLISSNTNETITPLNTPSNVDFIPEILKQTILSQKTGTNPYDLMN